MLERLGVTPIDLGIVGDDPARLEAALHDASLHADAVVTSGGVGLGDADHTRDVVTGKVPIEGVELTALDLTPEEIFYRFTMYREWDISELSMGKYIALRSQDDTSITAIPVFVSRVFRHPEFPAPSRICSAWAMFGSKMKRRSALR